MPSDNGQDTQRADAAAFRRIVLPLDGSAVAERAVPYAAALARLADAPLCLVRVLDPLHPGSPLGNLLALDALTLEVWLEGERIAAHDYLDHLRKDLQKRAPSVTVDYREGPTVDTLLAMTQPGDLLVMATHGRGGPARWFLGSTAEAVLRRATVPVFLVRADEEVALPPAMHRLVVPLDGSAQAEEALPMAEALATRLGIPVHLVTVLDLSGIAVLDFALAAVTADRLEDDVIEVFTEAERTLARGCERLRDSGITTTTDVLHGEPGLAIANTTQPGDVIVMTTHGRSGPARWLLGSVAETVVRRSSVPILLLRVAVEHSTSLTGDANA